MRVHIDPLILWAPFVLLLLLLRRDRRMVARWPQIGVLLLGSGAAVYGIWRLWLRPGPLTARDVTILYAVPGLAGGFFLPALVAWGRAVLWQDLRRILAGARRNVGGLATCVTLAAVFTVVYFQCGVRLAAAGAFDRDDIYFRADPVVYSHVLAGTARDHEQITHKHPLVPLLGNGLYRTVAWTVRPQLGPLAVSAVAGGLCVALAAVYFRRVTDSRVLAVLLAVLLGSSAAHVTFSAVPEAYTLSAAALILLHVLVAAGRGPALRLRHQVVAAVLAAGVTVTSALPALACFLCTRRGQRRFGLLLRWASLVTLLGCGLLTVQTHAFPAAALGITPEQYVGEARFLSPPAPLRQVVGDLARGLFLENVVASAPATVNYRALTILWPGAYEGWLNRITVGVWVLGALVAFALPAYRRDWRQPTLWAAVACLLISAGVHCVYGRDHLFLYSCTYTFYVLAIAAHGVRRLPRALAVTGVVLLVVLLAANNARFLVQVVARLEQLGT